MFTTELITAWCAEIWFGAFGDWIDNNKVFESHFDSMPNKCKDTLSMSKL